MSTNNDNVKIYRPTPKEQDELYELGYPPLRCEVCMKPFKQGGEYLKAIPGSPAYCKEHTPDA